MAMSHFWKVVSRELFLGRVMVVAEMAMVVLMVVAEMGMVVLMVVGEMVVGEMVPSSVSGSQPLHPLTSSGPPSPQYALHHQPNSTPYQTMTQHTIHLLGSHHSLLYIISSTLGSSHPLGQTIHSFCSPSQR